MTGLDVDQVVDARVRGDSWEALARRHGTRPDLLASAVFENKMAAEESYWSAIASQLLSDVSGCPSVHIWQQVRATWLEVSGWRPRAIWPAILGHELAGQMMRPYERIALAALPEIVSIWRGFSVSGGEAGWSWSLWKPTAANFAFNTAGAYELPRSLCSCLHCRNGRARYGCGDDPRVATASVPRGAVTALILSDQEYEVVVNPSFVTIHRVDRLPLSTRPCTKPLEVA